MRLSFAGSTGWFGSTQSSRLPLPFVSRTNGAQPCEAAASPVARNFFVLSQPATAFCGPPALVHSVSSASKANCRWCVVKQVSISANFLVFGSYIASWRVDFSTGKNLAEGWSEPCLQKAGLSSPRMRAVNQTRPSLSNIGLCTLAWLFQIFSSPQYGEGRSTGRLAALGVFASRTGMWIVDAVFFAGSSTGRFWVLSSVAP